MSNGRRRNYLIDTKRLGKRVVLLYDEHTNWESGLVASGAKVLSGSLCALGLPTDEAAKYLSKCKVCKHRLHNILGGHCDVLNYERKSND